MPALDAMTPIPPQHPRFEDMKHAVEWAAVVWDRLLQSTTPSNHNADDYEDLAEKVGLAKWYAKALFVDGGGTREAAN